MYVIMILPFPNVVIEHPTPEVAARALYRNLPTKVVARSARYYGSRIKSDILPKKLGFGFGREREFLSGPARAKFRFWL